MATPSAPPSIGSVPAPTSSRSTNAGTTRPCIHRCDVPDVRRKGAQAGFDGLFVADVREHRAEHRQSRSLRRRHAKAGLRHDREQPRGLERHGLAAGVGPGNQQHSRWRQQSDCHRHRSGLVATASRRRRCTPRCGAAGSSAPMPPVKIDCTDRISRGWRAASSSNEPSVVSFGSTPSTSSEKRARACSTSRSVAAPTVRCTSSGRSAKRIGQGQQDAVDFLDLLLLQARRCRC